MLPTSKERVRTLRRLLRRKLNKINENKLSKFIQNEAEEFKPGGPGYLRAKSQFTKNAKSKSRAKAVALSRKKSKSKIKSAPAILAKNTFKKRNSPKKYKLKIVKNL